MTDRRIHPYEISDETREAIKKASEADGLCGQVTPWLNTVIFKELKERKLLPKRGKQ